MISRQVSLVPLELNTTPSWEVFWERLKIAYPDRSAGFDRSKVTLEQDYWNLRSLSIHLTSSWDVSLSS